MTSWECVTVARANSPRGEIVLRKRLGRAADSVFELRVNGVCVMDTAETSSERALASHVLALVEHPKHVVIGGLGLGVTTRTLLADERVQRVTIAEMERCVVDWMRAGIIPQTSWLDDERIDIRIDDIRATVGALASFSADAIVLDVDNGPGHLVYDANDAIYQEPFLEVCRTALRPPGVLAIWSSHDSDDLAGNIARVFGGCDRQPVDVTLQNRPSEYWLFTGRARTV
jgi:spermidine synthase